MSLEIEENPATQHIDLVFLLAIAGRIDAQSRILAEKLDKERYIYYGYAVLDSLSSSYSMFKYFFDMFISNNDKDLMHDIMMTPGGIIAISIESIFLVSFSVLAARFDNEKKDSYKKMIVTAWPYFRDVIKGLKNAYKGWSSVVTACSLIGLVDIKYLLMPVGLVLGIFGAVNRLWLRNMVEARKVMMTANAELLIEIMKLRSLSHAEIKSYLDQIQYQSLTTSRLAFVGVAAGGFIDGLYLYVGLLGLATMAPPLLTAMAVICTIYTAVCMLTRVYEEYELQERLFISHTKCKLALITKEVETSYALLLFLQRKANVTFEEVDEIIRLQAEVLKLLGKFEKKREFLLQQTNRTYLSAVLLGIKNGLYAYSALASILFLIGSILILSGVAFPPALLVSCVVLGLIIMIGFTIQAVVANYNHLHKQPKIGDSSYHHLIELKSSLIEGKNTNELLDEVAFHDSIQSGLIIDSSPQYFFQEWFEVFRSLFSGVGKGQKFVDFAGNPLQEKDDQGHYHDTPFMFVLGAISGILFGIILALRALAKGLARPQLDQVNLAENEDTQPIIIKEGAEVVLQTKPKGESIQPIKNWTDSQVNRDTFLSSFSFFQKAPSKSVGRLHHSNSDGELNKMAATHESTILGLA